MNASFLPNSAWLYEDLCTSSGVGVCNGTIPGYGGLFPYVQSLDELAEIMNKFLAPQEAKPKVEEPEKKPISKPFELHTKRPMLEEA